MRTRPMGKDGPQVPVICHGAWPLGGGFGAVPEEQAIATVRASLDAGLTFIDTAESYRGSEALIGPDLIDTALGLRIDPFRPAHLDPGFDARNLSVFDQDIGLTVKFFGRIQHAPAMDENPRHCS